MDSKVHDCITQLAEISTVCTNHELAQDSYTAPGFIDFLNRPLYTDDIPMQSHNIEKAPEIARNPSSVPWEDSIKNFTLDLTSVQTDKKFSTCMILAELGYPYMETATLFINERYGNKNAVVVSVIPLDDSNDAFDIAIRKDKKVEYSTVTDRDYLVTTLSIWYVPNDTLLLCHSTSIDEYKEVLSMMPETTWSVSCSPTNFIESSISGNKCKYVCPIYTCMGSMETRVVGSGPLKLTGCKIDHSYLGKMNYYSRSIRGSRHSSGRCYDCEMLHRLVTSLQESNKEKDDTLDVKFNTSFLDSITN